MNRSFTKMMVGALAPLFLVACGSTEGETRPGQLVTGTTAGSEPNPERGAGSSDEPHTTKDLARLKGVSQLVLAGQVTSVETGLSYGQGAVGKHAIVTVEPTEALKGSAGKSVRVSILTELDGGFPYVEPATPVPAVGARGLWFLLEVDPKYAADTYRLASSGSEILFDDSGNVTNKGEAVSLAQANTLGTRDRILAVLRAAP